MEQQAREALIHSERHILPVPGRQFPLNTERTFATEQWSAPTSGANILESYSMFYRDKSWGELWKQSENKSMYLT